MFLEIEQLRGSVPNLLMVLLCLPGLRASGLDLRSLVCDRVCVQSEQRNRTSRSGFVLLPKSLVKLFPFCNCMRQKMNPSGKSEKIMHKILLPRIKRGTSWLNMEDESDDHQGPRTVEDSDVGCWVLPNDSIDRFG